MDREIHALAARSMMQGVHFMKDNVADIPPFKGLSIRVEVRISTHFSATTYFL